VSLLEPGGDRLPLVASQAWAGLRVALVHDWLTGMRGGEKVLEVLCRLFPDADLLTLVHAQRSVSTVIEARQIRPSFVQRLPRPTQWYRHYLPTFPTAIECFDLDDIDLVVSTSHCAAKSVVRTGRALHICYCHSPMRYAWDQFDAYFGPERVGRPTSVVMRHVMAWLARWDRDTASRVDHFIANSAFVAGRIERFYNRDAAILYPPVDTRFFTPAPVAPEPYFLVVSALVPYKRLDVAVLAAMRLGVPLKIVGSGPDANRLRSIAGSADNIELLGALEGEALRDIYRRARALVLPAEEDFGIAPVEAMACGRPVVALRRGGTAETVVHGVTGWLVDESTPEAFASAMAAVDSLTGDSATLAAHAAQFGVERFEAGIGNQIAAALAAVR
jgi:glycosyltransferase involved in cell wall biosynthesis